MGQCLGTFSSYLNAGDDYIEGVIADISDHKQAAALRQSELPQIVANREFSHHSL